MPRTTFHGLHPVVSINAAMRVLIPFVLGTLLLTGCVERRIYVRSEPVGADVYIDGEFIGQTRPENHVDGPLYANFIFYGTREYTIRKPGFETISGSLKLEAPWYEYPPIDFFAEVLAPWNIVDEHEVSVTMKRETPADVDSLYQRAQHYKYASRPEDRYEYAILRRPFGDATLPKTTRNDD